jgi:hypothetical protein
MPKPARLQPSAAALLRPSQYRLAAGCLRFVTAFIPILHGQEVQEDPWKWD